MNNELLVFKIQNLCKGKNFSMDKMLKECNLSKNVVYNIKRLYYIYWQNHCNIKLLQRIIRLPFRHRTFRRHDNRSER